MMTQECQRILCIDDEPNVLNALRRQLRKSYEVTTATSGQAGLAVLQEDGPFAVVVADYNMPGMNGVAFLHEVKRLAPGTVRVMLTAVAKLDVAISALHDGHVYRFMTKPWERSDLEKTLRDCLEKYRLTIKRKRFDNVYEESQQEIIRAARMDRLMQICNRGAFDEYYADLHARMAKSKGCYALILADVDNFKKYNDHYGHPAGDDVLGAIAGTMKNALRSQDFIGRYGGEEIVVLCEGAGSNEAQEIAERLRNAVWDLDIAHEYNCGHGRVTISLGVAVFDPGFPEAPKDLLASADAALYEAKQAGGRNTAILATPLSMSSGHQEAFR